MKRSDSQAVEISDRVCPFRKIRQNVFDSCRTLRNNNHFDRMTPQERKEEEIFRRGVFKRR